MTAPDTDVEKQAKRHRWPLVAFAAVVLVAAGFAMFFTGADEIAEEDATDATPTVVDDADG